MIPPPFGFRGKIPLYFPKSEEAYKLDPYEQYHTTVLRNTRNYLMSDFGDKSIDFVRTQMGQSTESRKVVELGCGIGYHMMRLAEEMVSDHFIGFDTSYQMLKMAEELWISGEGKVKELPESGQGHEEYDCIGKSLSNIQIGMSQADLLPLEDHSVDVVYSCFVIDRMPDIAAFITEQKRILKQDGRMIIVSPLNYQRKSSWNDWYPETTIIDNIIAQGFTLADQDRWSEKELMDKRGNGVEWSVSGFCFVKGD